MYTKLQYIVKLHEGVSRINYRAYSKYAGMHVAYHKNNKKTFIEEEKMKKITIPTIFIT